ncbi:rolling circle replication-associated protein [Streptococcus jiangjianxini]|uniref:rolling circle replication-associated protein n=1 Tax=Streptococcus jiangjianxini TaxID=3161189 RepID=UPI0032EAACB4
MKYNKRIVETSSYIEVWSYEKPIAYGFEKKKRAYKNNGSDDVTKYKRLLKSRYSAKHELMRLIDTNFIDNTTKFLTITTKDNIQDRSQFNSMFDKFMKRLNYYVFKTKQKKLKYVAVIEKQKRGSLHAHILLFNLPYIPHEILLKTWGNGSVWINKVAVDSKENRGRYITKYMEKGLGQELLENKGKKSYYSSKNLVRPKELRIFDKENIEDLVDDKLIVYQNEYISKVKEDGKWVENKVIYQKIKI